VLDVDARATVDVGRVLAGEQSDAHDRRRYLFDPVARPGDRWTAPGAGAPVCDAFVLRWPDARVEH
jgi:hypothetical protein